MAKQRKYKSPKTILRKVLEFFEANPENWTTGILHRKNKLATDGISHCAAGACLAFADSQKTGNIALRHLAAALGHKNADTASLNDVKQFIYHCNDAGSFGGVRIRKALKEACA